MLSWWLQADIHFNEDDQYQQNLTLTLQAMAQECSEQIRIDVHQEIQRELNVILLAQLGTWLSYGMQKVCVFTSGKGDILFRIIFSTSATSYLTAEAEGRSLKTKLELGLFDQFGLCMSINLVKVTIIGIEGGSLPKIKSCLMKAEVLWIALDDENNVEELKDKCCKTEFCLFLRDYETAEVKQTIEDFCSSGNEILSPLKSPESPLSDLMDDELYSAAELLELFD
ncbi:ORF22 hypothetical protein [Psittacine siadenovirus F]|nr:ORF22 hypothetical protein [Psittacine siadenovirus F]WGL41030.1 hypothetical protein [Psittacine siadenovirus F]WGL41055.1 hypothetical protein [Psittacine siadenovirus F]